MSLPNNYACEGQMSIFDLFSRDTWSGKTCQEPSAPIKEKTSGQSLKKQPKSSVKMPLFLDLRTENGHQAAVLWEMGGALLGEYMMRSFGEYPSEENVSLLSQILEDNPHPKYCLSAKACQGILRRAERRGKELPPLLKETLIRQASDGSNSMKSPNPNSGIYEAETTRTLDLNGGNPACNQGGMIVLEGNGQRDSHKGDGYKESETMYTLNTVEQHGVCTYQQTTGTLCASGYDKLGVQEALNDMYVIGTAYDGSQVSPTLTANNANGAQRMPDKENFNAVITYGLDRASFNQGQNAQYDFSIEEEKAQTLVSRGPGGVLSRQSVPYVQEITKE